MVVILEKPVSVAHERVVGLIPKIRVPACSGEKIKIIVVGAAIAGRKADQSPRETPCHTAWAKLARTVQRMARSQSGPMRPAPAGMTHSTGVSASAMARPPRTTAASRMTRGR